MKQIPKFFGYFADESGGIFSMRPICGGAKPPAEPRRLKPRNDRGYFLVTLHKDGKQYIRKVHRLILETFIGSCPEGMECCHNNGMPADNRLENLRWDTPKNNQADRKIHDTSSNGERQGSSKLNEMQVRVARRYCEMYGHGSQTEIAKVFCVVRGTIGFIISRKTWGHI
jgi:hypothetical protein